MSEINQRKDDHIDLVNLSQIESLDPRFNYEPLFGVHPHSNPDPFVFLGKVMNYPFWISSMTGGGRESEKLNKTMAEVCHELGIGMGLGSCRVLFEDASKISDFSLRNILGDQVSFYMNLGIAQIEEYLRDNRINDIIDMSSELQVDGMIIHINPLQEFFQPHGDKITKTPISIISEFMESYPLKVIVKEVGQGFGPKSLEALINLKVDGIELASFGGTNFTRLEKIRSNHSEVDFDFVGAGAIEMIKHLNNTKGKTDIIISGGMNNPLDCYYARSILEMNSVIGQASKILEFAKLGRKELKEYILGFITKMRLANNYLTIKKGLE